MTQQYLNPPVREVVCEFRYEDDGTWDGASPGLVYAALSDEFPRRLVEDRPAPPPEPSAQASRLLPPGAQQVGLRVVPELPLRFWRHNDESGVFAVAPYRLAVSHFRPYPSWEVFREIVVRGSQAYQDVLNPTGLNRIGLRYINAISVGQLPVELEEFFNFYPFVGPSIGLNVSRFHCLVQMEFEDGRDSLVLQMASIPSSEEQSAQITLDLDYFPAPSSQLDFEVITDWLERAHTNLQGVFEGCLTDSARELFR